jgi:hypothetical protein
MSLLLDNDYDEKHRMLRKISPGRSASWIPSIRMVSRKSLSIITVATVSLVLLLITSRRLGGWASLDGPYYHHGEPPHHHRPHGFFPEPHGHGKHNSSADGNPGMPFRPSQPNHDPLCEGFPDTRNIMLVMKTGASEAFDKVPTQLMTMLRCVADFHIYSDMEQRVAGYQVRDSLDTVLPEAMEGNADFDLYRRQRECDVDQDNCNKLRDAASDGWKLDKYKNIHIAEKVYGLRSDADWYVFVDADSYVLWPNLVQWLRTLNPRKKLYLGSTTLINSFGFAHGGSGYILSQAAMNKLVGQNPGVANMYDKQAKNECCGDYLFAVALKKFAELTVQQTVRLDLLSPLHFLPIPSPLWDIRVFFFPRTLFLFPLCLFVCGPSQGQETRQSWFRRFLGTLESTG